MIEENIFKNFLVFEVKILFWIKKSISSVYWFTSQRRQWKEHPVQQRRIRQNDIPPAFWTKRSLLLLKALAKGLSLTKTGVPLNLIFTYLQGVVKQCYSHIKCGSIPWKCLLLFSKTCLRPTNRRSFLMQLVSTS